MWQESDRKVGSKYYGDEKYSKETYKTEEDPYKVEKKEQYYKEEEKEDPYKSYKPEYKEPYYSSTPPPWYKPNKYYKPAEPQNAEPAPMPEPLAPYEKVLTEFNLLDPLKMFWF